MSIKTKPLVVIDTNIWIRVLLRGRISIPILEAIKVYGIQLLGVNSFLEFLN